MGALPFDGSCRATLRVPERVIRECPWTAPPLPSTWSVTALHSRPAPGRSSRLRWSAHSRPSTRGRWTRWCWPGRSCRGRCADRCTPRRATLQRRGAGVVRLPVGSAGKRLEPGRRLAGDRHPPRGPDRDERSPGRHRPPIAGSGPGPGDRPPAARRGQGAARAPPRRRGCRRRDGAVLLEPRRRRGDEPRLDVDALAPAHGHQGTPEAGRAGRADHGGRPAPDAGGLRHAAGGSRRPHHRLEPFDRRFFAGLVGWVDARGDGGMGAHPPLREVSGADCRGCMREPASWPDPSLLPKISRPRRSSASGLERSGSSRLRSERR